MSKPHGHVFNAALVCSSCGLPYRHKAAPCVPEPRKLARAAAQRRRRKARTIANPFTPEEIAAIERALGRKLGPRTASARDYRPSTRDGFATKAATSFAGTSPS